MPESLDPAQYLNGLQLEREALLRAAGNSMRLYDHSVRGGGSVATLTPVGEWSSSDAGPASVQPGRGRVRTSPAHHRGWGPKPRSAWSKACAMCQAASANAGHIGAKAENGVLSRYADRPEGPSLP